MKAFTDRHETNACGLATSLYLEGFEVEVPAANALVLWAELASSANIALGDLEVVTGDATLRFMPMLSENSHDANRGILLTGIFRSDENPRRAHFVFPIDRAAIHTIDSCVSRDFGLRCDVNGRIRVVVAGKHDRVRLWWQGPVNNDAWRLLRAKLGLDRRKVFEISAQSFRDAAEFQTAIAQLEAADKELSSGRYTECALKSRMVVESVLRTLGLVAAKSGNWQPDAVAKHMRELGFTADTSEAVELMLRGFSRFASAAAHPSAFAWSRADAEFALHLAASLGAYVGAFPKRVRPSGEHQ